MPSTNKSCLPFAGRSLFTILLVIASIWNLLTRAAARAPALVTTLAATTTPSSTSAVQVSIVPDTPTLAPGPAGIPTQTLQASLTPTSTATSTLAPSPTPAACALWDYWPAHIVQWGDTLYALAHATGSTVQELKGANCLSEDQIYAGQLLYVPRLPYRTAVPTPGAGPASPPAQAGADMPTSFQDASAIIPLCYYPYGIYFAVKVPDGRGIRSVSAVYSINGGPLAEVPMSPVGISFYGLAALSGWEPAAGTVYYYFKAIDDPGHLTNSSVGTAALMGCTGG